MTLYAQVGNGLGFFLERGHAGEDYSPRYCHIPLSNFR